VSVLGGGGDFLQQVGVEQEVVANATSPESRDSKGQTQINFEFHGLMKW